MNCDKLAVALLTFSPPDAKAWLYDLNQPDPTGGIMLCRKHANATIVPMSWQLIDVRDPAWPGPAGSRPAVQAMAAASVEEFIPRTDRAASDIAALDEELAAMRADLPTKPRQPEPQMATAGAAGRPATSDRGMTPAGNARVSNTDAAAEPDQSLFELPISDIPAVTPHPGY